MDKIERIITPTRINMESFTRIKEVEACHEWAIQGEADCINSCEDGVNMHSYALCNWSYWGSLNLTSMDD